MSRRSFCLTYAKAAATAQTPHPPIAANLPHRRPFDIRPPFATAALSLRANSPADFGRRSGSAAIAAEITASASFATPVKREAGANTPRGTRPVSI